MAVQVSIINFFRISCIFRRYYIGPNRLIRLIPSVYEAIPKRATSSFSLATPEQALPHWKGKRLSPVSIRDASNPSNIQCYCPATGQFLDSIPAATTYDIDNIIERAGEAQKLGQHLHFLKEERY